MHYLIVICFQMAAMYWLSGRVHQSMAQTFFNRGLSRGQVVWALQIVYWPGVLVHELSHLVVGRLLLVKTYGLTLRPQIQPDGMVAMGSVQVPHTDRVRFFIIGVAPVFVGTGLIFTILWLADHYGLLQFWWWWIVVAYAIFQVANNMFLSRSDLRGAWILVVVLVGLYWLSGRPSMDWVGPWLDNYAGLLAQAQQWLWLPIIINLVFLAMLYVLGSMRRGILKG